MIKKSFKYLTVLTCTLLLGACSKPNNYTIAPVKTIEELEYSQTVKELNTIDWPTDTWWEKFNDPQLNILISEAIKDSPNMHIAQARLKRSQGIARRVGAIQKVQIGAAADASLTKVSYQYQNYLPPENWNDYGSLTLHFSYEFDFWGKNKALVAAATSSFVAAEAEEAASRLVISTSVAHSYAELARLYASEETVAAAVVVRQKTVELLGERHKEGLENQGAVSQARSAAARAEAGLLVIQEAIELQKNAIASLLGKGPDRGRIISRPSVVLSENYGLPENIGIGLLGHRPDITASRWRAEAAAQGITVAKAQFYPNINISAFIGYQAFGLDNLFNSGNDAGSISPALYLPIFTGGRLEGQLTAAEASYEEAVGGYNAVLTEAIHEVADVVTSTRALDAQIEKTRVAVEAARGAHQIASNRYKGGLARYLDVLTAEDVLLDSERALVNLESRAFSLDIALIHALGGGYQK